MSDHPVAHVALKASDAAFAMVALGTVIKLLPALAALLSCIWYLIRIGEWMARKLRRQPGDEPGSDD